MFVSSRKLCATFFIVSGAFYLQILSCGAPLKKADDVEGIFSSTAQLGEKMANLCSTLDRRQEAPNLRGVELGLEACTRAGLQAQNLNLSQPVTFAALRVDGKKFSDQNGNGDTAFLRYQTRAEIWLGKPLLRLVSNLLPSLKDKSSGILGAGGLQNNAGGQAGLTVRVLGEPQFDAATFKFSVRLYIESLRTQNGVVDIRNNFKIDGMLLDKKYVAVTVETTDNPSSDKSLINSGKIVLLVVPHASDVFIDVSLDMVFHSFGVDNAMKTEIQKQLGETLKTTLSVFDSIGSGQPATLQPQQSGPPPATGLRGVK